MLLFLLSAVLFFGTAYCINRFLPHRRFTDWLLGLVLIQFALLVATFILAGAVWHMNQPAFILLLQGGELLVSGEVCWLLWGKTHPMPKPQGIQLHWQQDWAVILLLAVSLGVLLVNLVLVWAVPPNNNDSLMIHLARVGMWHQNGSWLPWETRVVWQLSFPLNAELFAYWTLLFTGGEHLLGLYPLLTGMLSAVVIHQLGLAMSRNRRLSLLAALVWLALPVVQLNLTSTRHDHVSTFLLLACLYFLYEAIDSKSLAPLLLAGLSMGLAIGTNFAVVAYLPGFFLLVLAGWLWKKVFSTRQVLLFAGFSLAAFLLFSSPIFISNQRQFGSLLGPDALEMTSQSSTNTEASLPEHAALLLARWGYQMADSWGLPQPLMGYAFKAKAYAADWLSHGSGVSLESPKSLLNQHVFDYSARIPFSEDSAWFGWIGAVLALITAPWIVWRTVRRRELPLIWITGFLLTTAISYALVRSGWTPYDGRYFMPLMALICIGCTILLAEKEGWLRWLVPLMSLASTLMLVLTLANNPAKSLTGEFAFYHLPRFDMISAQSYETKDMLYLVDQAVPADSVLGLATPDNVYYEYGLFGEHFERRLVPLTTAEQVCDAVWLASKEVDYLLVDTGDGTYPGCTPKGFKVLDSMNRWMVLVNPSP